MDYELYRVYFDYSRKEFCEKYKEFPEITAFFKHSDRISTIHPELFDFYSLWGIDPLAVKDPFTERDYRIPVEVADLFSLLIRTFRSAYGADRRGQTKGGLPKKYSIESYTSHQQSIERILNGKDFPPFLACLIKNHDSYNQTKVFAAFMPLLLERIAVLLTVVTKFGTSNNHEIYYITAQEIDKLIEGIIRNRMNAPLPQSKLYSFEDAISEAFKILTSNNFSTLEIHNKNIAFAEALISTKLDFIDGLSYSTETKPSTQDVATQRPKLVDLLTQAAAPFIERHQQEEALTDKNINEIREELNSFWDVNSSISRRELVMVEEYHRDLVHFISFLSDTGESIDVVEKKLKEAINLHIELGQYITAHELCKTLSDFQRFEDELNLIKERSPQNDDEWVAVIQECVSTYKYLFTSGSLQEDDRSVLRDAICSYYQEIKTDPAYKDLTASLKDVMAKWLPDLLHNK